MVLYANEEALRNSLLHKAFQAEGKGFEPSTPYGASDFESDEKLMRSDLLETKPIDSIRLADILIYRCYVCFWLFFTQFYILRST